MATWRAAYGSLVLSASLALFQYFAKGSLFASHVSLSCTEVEDTSEDDSRGKRRRSVHRIVLYSRSSTFNPNDTPLSLIRKRRRVHLVVPSPP
ncbi:hypothetical protein BKA70DRAFT_1313968 [Coprinopsis sp. MPI-PUGE-AT-0042]|nr:hypothetical protein BKA70DRAFT_1313968 [Coprinopsis sp. MPI-PUGE-AT-0042]